MRLLISDHFSNAYESLRSNRMRTFLTGVGVTIGVASITAILSLSAGINNIMQGQVDALEGNIVIIRPGATLAQSDFIHQQGFASSTITETDLKEIQKLPNIQAIAPLIVMSGGTAAGDTKQKDTSVVATTPELEKIASLKILDGQFIDSSTNQLTSVIGNQLSVNLFGTDQSIGKTFTIKGQRFTVIGVLKRLNDPINFNDVDFDNAAIIHLQAGKDLSHGNTQIQQINVRAETADKLPSVIASIKAVLDKTHTGEDDYQILSGSEIAEPTGKLFTAVQGISAAIAGISLFVGGIGIMNIMLVTVAERTREIGLRKAIGASNAHIVWQFLIESLIIGIVGGIIGYVSGYIIAFGISTFLTFDPVFTWQIFGIAMMLSVLVGTIFGLYPAIRAARKDPIESLRHYQ